MFFRSTLQLPKEEEKSSRRYGSFSCKPNLQSFRLHAFQLNNPSGSKTLKRHLSLRTSLEYSGINENL